MSEIETRAAKVGEVNFPKRTIELIVMPYEQTTEVDYRGRMIEEIVSRTAFAGVEERTSQIKVNLDHRVEVSSTIGRAVALYPSRDEGLVAEVRIGTAHPMADHTLEMADSGDLGASAGFKLLVDKQTGKVKQDAEVWERRDRRRLNHLFLHHIAMTPDPAYVGAQVLAVRSADTVAAETPLLLEWRVQELERLAADLDARYGLTR